MTKKELDFIGSMNMCDEISNEAYKKIVNHVEETEISDDCVSREQAIKTIGTDIQLNLEGRSGLLKYSDEIKDILKALLDSQEKKLKALPPVTLHPKTGHWIDTNSNDFEFHSVYKCSECGLTEIEYPEGIYRFRYCPNCGAKMVEPQERSGEE